METQRGGAVQPSVDPQMETQGVVRYNPRWISDGDVVGWCRTTFGGPSDGDTEG